MRRIFLELGSRLDASRARVITMGGVEDQGQDPVWTPYGPRMDPVWADSETKGRAPCHLREKERELGKGCAGRCENGPCGMPGMHGMPGMPAARAERDVTSRECPRDA